MAFLQLLLSLMRCQMSLQIHLQKLKNKIRRRSGWWEFNYRRSVLKRNGSAKVSEFAHTRSPHKDDFKWCPWERKGFYLIFKYWFMLNKWCMKCPSTATLNWSASSCHDIIHLKILEVSNFIHSSLFMWNLICFSQYCELYSVDLLYSNGYSDIWYINITYFHTHPDFAITVW